MLDLYYTKDNKIALLKLMSRYKNLLPTKSSAEIICLLIIFFILSVIIYSLGFIIFSKISYILGKDNTNIVVSYGSLFKDATTFGTSISSIVLATTLYSDWREKYIFETLDKDLKDINGLIYELQIYVNQYPIIDNENKTDQFFKLYWKYSLQSENISHLVSSELEENLIKIKKLSLQIYNSLLMRSNSQSGDKDYGDYKNMTHKFFEQANSQVDEFNETYSLIKECIGRERIQKIV